MNLHEAVALLRKHNEWRRSNRTENWEPMPYSPAQLGQAIDIVCHAAKEGAPPGYKAVLKFPSNKMIDAGIEAHRNDCEREQTGRGALVCMIWYAMINCMDD